MKPTACVCAAISIAVLLLGAVAPAAAKVKATSTDGEATVYLTADFTHDFDLAYRIDFAPKSTNKAWSVVSILLLNGVGNGASVSVGLSRGFPNPTTLAAFTTANAPGEKADYRSVPVACARTCLVELRGTATAIAALVEGHSIGRWSRRRLQLDAAAVQVNAEVAELGDALHATMSPVRTLAAGQLIDPSCAFTTQGIEPHLQTRGAISFEGVRRKIARVTYISLVDGSTGDSCDLSHATRGRPR